jgi:hypothetical protein
MPVRVLGFDARQVSNEDSTERLRAERTKVADRLEAMARWMPVLVIPIALLGLVDIGTGQSPLAPLARRLRAEVLEDRLLELGALWLIHGTHPTDELACKIPRDSWH